MSSLCKYSGEQKVRRVRSQKRRWRKANEDWLVPKVNATRRNRYKTDAAFRQANIAKANDYHRRKRQAHAFFLFLIIRGCALALFLITGCTSQTIKPAPDLNPYHAIGDFSPHIVSLQSFAQPEVVTPPITAPVLIWLAPPPSDLQIIWPNEQMQTNYNWFFEVADEPIGPWRYPDEPQFPDDTNWIIHLDGAHYLRLRGSPL